jgi:hypothetical protein
MRKLRRKVREIRLRFPGSVFPRVAQARRRRKIFGMLLPASKKHKRRALGNQGALDRICHRRGPSPLRLIVLL